MNISPRWVGLFFLFAGCLPCALPHAASLSQPRSDAVIEALGSLVNEQTLSSPEQTAKLLGVRFSRAVPLSAPDEPGRVTGFEFSAQPGTSAPAAQYRVYVQASGLPGDGEQRTQISLAISDLPSDICIPSNVFDASSRLLPLASSPPQHRVFALKPSAGVRNEATIRMDISFAQNAECAQRIDIVRFALPINAEELKLEADMAARNAKLYPHAPPAPPTDLPPAGRAADQPITRFLRQVLDARDLTLATIPALLGPAPDRWQPVPFPGRGAQLPANDGQIDAMAWAGKSKSLRLSFDYRVYMQGSGDNWAMLTNDDRPVVASLHLANLTQTTCVHLADITSLFARSPQAPPEQLNRDGSNLIQSFSAARFNLPPSGTEPNKFWDITIPANEDNDATATSGTSAPSNFGAAARFDRKSACLISMTIFQTVGFKVPGTSNAWHRPEKTPASALDKSDLLARLNKFRQSSGLVDWPAIKQIFSVGEEKFLAERGDSVLSGVGPFDRKFSYSVTPSGSRHVIQQWPPGQHKELPNDLAILSISWPETACFTRSDFEPWLNETPWHTDSTWKVGMELSMAILSDCVTGIIFHQYTGLRIPDLVEETDTPVSSTHLHMFDPTGKQTYPRPSGPDISAEQSQVEESRIKTLLDGDLRNGDVVGKALGITMTGWPLSVSEIGKEAPFQAEQTTPYGTIDWVLYAAGSRYVYRGHSELASMSLTDFPEDTCVRRDTILSWFPDAQSPSTVPPGNQAEAFQHHVGQSGTESGLIATYRKDRCADSLKIVQYEPRPLDEHALEGAMFRLQQVRPPPMDYAGFPLQIQSNPSPRLKNE